MSKDNERIRIEYGFILFLVLLILKLTGTVDWSWWWITAPIWGGLAIAAAIFIVVYLISKLL